MVWRLVKTKNCKTVRNPRVGVAAGIAGSWASPNYIPNPSSSYTLGTRQYYNQTAIRVRHAYDSYIHELDTTYG